MRNLVRKVWGKLNGSLNGFNETQMNFKSKKTDLCWKKFNFWFRYNYTAPFDCRKKCLKMLEVLIDVLRKNQNIVNINNWKVLKISFIIFWNSDGAFFSPNDITFHSYCPEGTLKAVLYLVFFWNLDLPKSWFHIKFWKYFCIWNSWIKFDLFGIGYLIYSKTLFKGL